MLKLFVFLGLLCCAAFAQEWNEDYVQTGLTVSEVVSVYFDGGIDDCSNCGPNGDYACSAPVIGNWENGTKYFRDPSPDATYVLTNVSATVYGSYSCYGNPVLVKLSLQGEMIDNFFLSGTGNCQCGTCSGPVGFVNNLYFKSGWPNYQYGDTNQLKIDVGNSDSICLYKVDLNLTFVQTKPRKYVNLDVILSGGANNCSVCGDPNAFSCSSTALYGVLGSFNDPLPPSSVAVSISARVYGAYEFTDSHYLTTYVGNAAIGNAVPITGTTSSIPCQACQGGINFFSPTSYQAGWPGYVYGGTNSVNVKLNYDHRFCVGIVQLSISYFTR